MRTRPVTSAGRPRPPASAPDPAVRRALEAIAIGFVAVTARALQATEPELTLAQWRVLMIVGGSPAGATVSDVAARLGSELSPASRVIRRLDRRGLVATGKTDPDRRVTRVRLTDDGRAIRQDVLERRRTLLVEVLSGAGIVDAAGAELLARLGDAFHPFV